MAKFGYKLMSEEHGPKALVRNAALAEDAGFDFVAISDHYLPWHEAQGHSPFAWSVLGGVAQATSRVGIATGLTCPLIRYHPAIVAQAAATVAVMCDGRFTLALGAGERLNEHITGAHWPGVDERHERLEEAIDIIRLLWSGEMISYPGNYYEVERARLYDLPAKPIEIVVGISGDKSATLAAETGSGIMATEPEKKLIDAWRKGGGKGSRYGEVAISYGPSAEKALAVAHERFRFGVLGWEVNAELATPGSFDAAVKTVRKEDMAEIPCGPDVETHLKAVKAFVKAGFDHVAITAIGPDQEAFIKFYKTELGPALRKL